MSDDFTKEFLDSIGYPESSEFLNAMQFPGTYIECKVPCCGWVTYNAIKGLAGCAATWHMYESHPEIWLCAIGDRPPRDPDPRTKEGLAAILSGIPIPGN